MGSFVEYVLNGAQLIFVDTDVLRIGEWNPRTEHACSLHATDNSSKSARGISPRMYHVICSVVKRKPCISHRQLDNLARACVCVSNRFVRISNWSRLDFFPPFKQTNDSRSTSHIYLTVSEDLKDHVREILLWIFSSTTTSLIHKIAQKW